MMNDKSYTVRTGINFPKGQRREAGETVKESELPKSSLKWLLADGHIEPTKEADNGRKSR